jgi:hypothetical protein
VSRHPSNHFTLTISISTLLCACAGGPRQTNEDYGWEKQDLNNPSSGSDTSSNTTSPGGGDGTEDTKWTGASDGPKLNKEQIEQMEIALKRGGTKASNCSTVVENAPTGEGVVNVTFDGKIGKITDVDVNAPFAGTPVEQCIKRSFIGEYCLPFEGDPKVVKYTVKLPPKAAAPAPDPKKK